MKLDFALPCVTMSLFLASCSFSSDDENADTAEVASDESAENLAPEEAGLFDSLFNDGEPLKLAIQENHPNGTMLKLNSIQVKPTETVLNITAVNGHTRNIDLNWTNKKTYLLADNRKFFLVPPVDNDDIQIQSGQTVTGDFVFIGAVPVTESLKLVINESSSGGSKLENTGIPSFSIPIPMNSSAYSDDGSKKKSAK